MLSKLLALLNSTHLVPSLAVTLFAVLFGFGLDLTLERVVLVGLAVLMQQFSVGLSNDWLDFERDTRVNRIDKPAATGRLSITTVRNFAFIAAALSLVFAFGLGEVPGLVMLPMLVLGWSYNLGLKANALSVIPYALGFGILPVFVALSSEPPTLPDYWVVIVAALLGISAHFANVLPDLIEDRETGVRALPHLLGQRVSAVVIAVTAVSASLIVVSQSTELNQTIAIAGLAITATLAVAASVLALQAKPPRIIFPMLILASLVNVVLLMLG